MGKTRIIVTVWILLFGSLLCAATSYAGSLEGPQPAPNDIVPTLTDIFNRLDGKYVDPGAARQVPASGPTSGTGVSLQDIYNKIDSSSSKTTMTGPFPPDMAPVQQVIGADGSRALGVPLPSPRFEETSPGIVYDRLTGLSWLKQAQCFGWVTNDYGKAYIQALNNGSYDGICLPSGAYNPGDWRLPSLRELFSLIDFRYILPAISNSAGDGPATSGDPFTSLQRSVYWSSTPPALGSSVSLYVLNLGNSSVSTVGRTSYAYVLPVRGGLVQSPVAKIAPSSTTTVLPGASVVFSGAGSYLPGKGNAVATYRWLLRSSPDGYVHDLAGDGTATFTLNTDGNLSGVYTVGLVVNFGTWDSQITEVTVNANHPPVVAAPQEVSVNEDDSVTGQVTAADPDGAAFGSPTLTYALDTDVQHGTLDFQQDGSFTYTPSANYYGADSFTFKASDGLSTSVTSGTVNVTVVNIADAPVNDVAPVVEGTAQVGETLTATTTDADWTNVDGTVLTYAYQWQSDDDGVAGGEVNLTDPLPENTYVLQAADEGKFIRVRVVATSSVAESGTSAEGEAFSSLVGPVAAAPPAP